MTARPRSVLAVFGVAAAILLGFAVTLGDPQTERGNPYWAPTTLSAAGGTWRSLR